MQAFPAGFQRYWDKEPSLSATINKFLRTNDLKQEPGQLAEPTSRLTARLA